MNAFSAHRCKKYCYPRKLIEEIDSAPPSPPPCPPGKLKIIQRRDLMKAKSIQSLPVSNLFPPPQGVHSDEILSLKVIRFVLSQTKECNHILALLNIYLTKAVQDWKNKQPISENETVTWVYSQAPMLQHAVHDQPWNTLFLFRPVVTFSSHYPILSWIFKICCAQCNPLSLAIYFTKPFLSKKRSKLQALAMSCQPRNPVFGLGNIRDATLKNINNFLGLDFSQCIGQGCNHWQFLVEYNFVWTH